MIRRRLAAALLLCALIGRAYTQTPQPIAPDPPPGAYSEPVEVSIEYEGVLRYRFADSTDESWVTYSRPPTLSAVAGEERRYSILIEDPQTGESLGPFNYTIDRRQPSAPTPQPAAGAYRSPVNVSFDTDNTVVLLRPGSREFEQWDGRPLLLDPGPSQRAEFVITAYSVDSAGNSGPARQHRYTVDRSSEREPSLRVVSPTSGDFANPQSLIVEANGVARIEYAIDGAYSTYEGVTELPAGNDMRLTARAVVDGEVVAVERVSFSAGEQRLPGFSFGVISQAQTINLDDAGGLEFRMGAILDSQPWTPLPATIELNPVAGLARAVRIDVREGGSEELFRYVYLLDGSIPDPPLIRVARAKHSADITIEGDPGTQLRYTTDSRAVDADSIVYAEPFSIEFPDDQQGSLIVQARAFSSSGRASRTATARIPFDTRVPPPPVLRWTTIAGKSILIAADLPEQAPEGTVAVFESAYNTDDVRSPLAGSPVLTDNVIVSAPYGSTQTVAIRVASRTPAGIISAESELVTATLDHQPPPAPLVSIDQNLFVVTGEGSLFYRLLRDGVPSSVQFAAYEQPVEVPTEGGRTISYAIEAYAADAFGNQSSTVTSQTIAVEAPIPMLPQITGFPEGGRTREPVTFGVPQSASRTVVRYTLTSDGSAPAEPSNDSPLLDGATISGTPGNELLYRIAVRPFVADAAGETVEIALIVDRRPPAAPSQPQVQEAGDDIVIAIDRRPGERVYYRVLAQDGDRQPEFVPLSGPIIAAVQDGTLTVEYYAEDSVGNHSEVASLELTPEVAPPPPRLVGASDGGVYREAVTIGADSEATVLFELGTDADPPADPDSASAELDRLEVGALEGEVVGYILKARTSDGEQLSDVTTLRFVIDRLPPSVPTLVEESVGGTRRVRLVAVDAQVYARTSDSESFQPVDGAIEVPEGEYRSFTVTAYAQDDAGNRSDSTSFTVYADEDVVYVDPTREQEGDGSRESPHRSIRAAVESAATMRSPVLFLASGRYETDSPFEIDRTISIIGGLDPSSWAASDQPTVLTVGRGFDSREVLIALGANAELRAENIAIEDQKGYIRALIRSDGATAELVDVQITTGAEGTALVIDGGRTTLERSTISSNYGRSWPLVSVSNGELLLDDGLLTASNARGEARLLEVTNATATLQRMVVRLDGGTTTRLISARDATLRIIDSGLSSTAAALGGIAVEASSTALAAEGSSIEARHEAPSVGLLLRRGTSVLDRTDVFVTGERSVQAILASGGSLDAAATAISVRAGIGFAVGITGDQASVRIETTRMNVVARGDAAGVSVLDAGLSLFHTSIWINSEVDGAVAIHHGGRGSVALFNNVVAADSEGGAVTGVHLERLPAAQAAGNAFAHTAPILTADRPRRDVLTAGELDALLRPERFEAFSSLALRQFSPLTAGSVPSELRGSGADLRSINGPQIDSVGDSYDSPPTIGPYSR